MMSANGEVLHAKCENWKYSIAILFFLCAPRPMDRKDAVSMVLATAILLARGLQIRV